MKKMTDDQVVKHHDGLTKKHRAEIAKAVVELYLPGRSNRELAKLLNRDATWITRQIDTFALADCVEYQTGGSTGETPRIVGATSTDTKRAGASKQTDAILSEQRKSLRKQDGYEERKEQLKEEYADQLMLTEEDIPKNEAMLDRLAESYMATESAIESDKIVIEDNGKRAQLQPTGKPVDRKSWEWKLADAFGKFRAAYHTFDNASPSELKQARTRKVFAEMVSDFDHLTELVSIYHEEIEK